MCGEQVKVGDRVLPVAAFRGSTRPVLVVGSKGHISRSLRAAEPFRSELRQRGVSLITLQTDGLDSNSQLDALKKEFGRWDVPELNCALDDIESRLQDIRFAHGTHFQPWTDLSGKGHASSLLRDSSAWLGLLICLWASPASDKSCMQWQVCRLCNLICRPLPPLLCTVFALRGCFVTFCHHAEFHVFWRPWCFLQTANISVVYVLQGTF